MNLPVYPVQQVNGILHGAMAVAAAANVQAHKLDLRDLPRAPQLPCATPR